MGESQKWRETRIRRLAAEFVNGRRRRGRARHVRHSLAASLQRLQHVVAELGQARAIENADKGPLRHPVGGAMVRQQGGAAGAGGEGGAGTEGRPVRGRRGGGPAVISRKDDTKLMHTLRKVLREAGPPPPRHRRGFFDE